MTLDHWGGRKTLFFLPSLWSNDMDIEAIEVFQMNPLGSADQKAFHFDQLRHRQKNDVNRRLVINFF